jgi:hypothetical protein
VSTWLVVWFIVAIISTGAVIACLVALARHVLVVGRAAKEFQAAVQPLADAITADGDRASQRSSSLQVPGRRPSTGRE